MKRRYERRSLERLSRRSRLWMHWLLLHDRGLFGQHVASLAGRMLTSWIILDWSFYWAVFTGIGNLKTIRRKRNENRRNSIRSDRELLRLLENFYRTAPIVPRDS
jgi:hypothetical protein